jgi:predicted dehydrogenase
MMKILMVGLGGIGQRHTRNLSTILGDRLELMAYRTQRVSPLLTDRLQVEPGGDVEERYRIRVFTDLDEALDQKPEATFICNPSNLHIPVAIKAAQAGCHLFLEKPISDDTEGILQLMEIVQEKRLIGYVGYQMRFHPCLRYVKDLLARNGIGTILAAQAEVGEYLPGWHTYEDYRQMYAARRDLGGGVILTQIHEMDYLYWLFGLPHRIFSLGGHLSSLEIDVEDIASSLIEFKVNGNLVPVQLHQDYVQRPPTRTLQIIGNLGRVNVDLVNLSVRYSDADGQLVDDIHFDGFQRNQLFIDELTHFLACIRGEEKPLVSIQDGLISLQMALAAKQSIETGRVVDIPGLKGQ